jgi:hypothetical protein
MSSKVSNLLPLRVILSLGIWKKLGGRDHMNRRGCGMVEIACFTKNCLTILSRHIIVEEEPAYCSPHFESLFSYYIPQTSQNHQINILITYLIFRSEFIIHTASIIKKPSNTAFTHECTCHAFLG